MTSAILRAGGLAAVAGVIALALADSASASTIVSNASAFAGQQIQLSVGAARQLVGTEGAIAILPSTATSGGAGFVPLLAGLAATLVGFVLVRRSQTS
jgi:hypothetical protein